MIWDSSTAINDWQIYPGLGAVIYSHTHTLTHGHRRHSRSHAQSCVSVGLVWSFGTIIKPRLNMSDCRQQIIGIRPAATGSPPLSSDVVASGFRTHLIFQSRYVPSAREAYRYRIGVG